MKYPYYIIVVQTGRLPAPVKFLHTPIAKQFKSGQIGGKKTQEFTSSDPEEALHIALREAFKAEPQVYIVKEERKHRESMRDWRVALRKEIKYPKEKNDEN